MKRRADGDGDGAKRGGLVTRRSVLAGAVVLSGGVLGLRLPSREAPLRPPGAIAEPEFARTCIRCQRCATVCPPKAIRFDSSANPAGSDTPYIDAQQRGCTLCMKCTQVCPSGALTPIEPDPASIRSSVRMGRPVLDEGRCVAWNGEGECRACYYVCPYADSAVRLDRSLLQPVFDAQECVGCGLCEEACPERARAIHIEPGRGDAA